MTLAGHRQLTIVHRMRGQILFGLHLVSFEVVWIMIKHMTDHFAAQEYLLLGFQVVGV